ncbi:MAG: hypothetical protein LBS41_03740 [Streptococcaceae bacterium]|nr:hypothetical protein [Streptococcaceae bacterium]
MQQAESEFVPSISLFQIIKAMQRYWLTIIIGTLVLGVGANLLVRHFEKPLYQADVRIVVQADDIPATGITKELIDTDTTVIKTFQDILDDRGVRAEISAALAQQNLTYTKEQLAGMLKIHQNTDSQVCMMIVTGQRRKEVATIANVATSVFVKNAETFLGIKHLLKMAPAETPKQSVSPNYLMITGIGAAIGFGLASLAAVIKVWFFEPQRVTD